MTDGGFGPGIGAFTVFLLLAIALWLLMRNMNSRLRRMSYADRSADRSTPGPSAVASTPAQAQAPTPHPAPGTLAGSGDAGEGDRGRPEVRGEGQNRQ